MACAPELPTFLILLARSVTLLRNPRTRLLIPVAEMSHINKTDLVKGAAQRGKWTGELVINRLEAAFRMHPNAAMNLDAAMLVAWPDFPSDGPIKGRHLIQATGFALGPDSPARIHLLYHAHARGTGEPIHELCRRRSWKKRTHFYRVRAASTAIAEWLNTRSMSVPMFADNPAHSKRGADEQLDW